jgi:hypothetical protein
MTALVDSSGPAFEVTPQLDAGVGERAVGHQVAFGEPRVGGTDLARVLRACEHVGARRDAQASSVISVISVESTCGIQAAT